MRLGLFVEEIVDDGVILYIGEVKESNIRRVLLFGSNPEDLSRRGQELVTDMYYFGLSIQAILEFESDPNLEVVYTPLMQKTANRYSVRYMERGMRNMISWDVMGINEKEATASVEKLLSLEGRCKIKQVC